MYVKSCVLLFLGRQRRPRLRPLLQAQLQAQGRNAGGGLDSVGAQSQRWENSKPSFLKNDFPYICSHEFVCSHLLEDGLVLLKQGQVQPDCHLCSRQDNQQKSGFLYTIAESPTNKNHFLRKVNDWISAETKAKEIFQKKQQAKSYLIIYSRQDGRCKTGLSDKHFENGGEAVKVTQLLLAFYFLCINILNNDWNIED